MPISGGFKKKTSSLNARIGYHRRERLVTAAETLEMGMSELVKGFIDECFTEYLNKRGIIESGGQMTIAR